MNFVPYDPLPKEITTGGGGSHVPRRPSPLPSGSCGMTNLKFFLVGCEPKLVPQVRSQLDGLGIDVEDEISDYMELVHSPQRWDVRSGVFLFQVRSRLEIPQITELAAAIPNRPIVALVEGPDHSLLVAANRAGASQVVLLPLHPDDFRDALDRVASQYGELQGRTRVVAVAGVTGGCGTTT